MASDEGRAFLNTDRELYREPKGDLPSDYYANSLHVTAQGAIGMNVGGTVYTLPIREWHALAGAKLRPTVSAGDVAEVLAAHRTRGVTGGHGARWVCTCGVTWGGSGLTWRATQDAHVAAMLAPLIEARGRAAVARVVAREAAAWDAGWLCRDVGSNVNPYRAAP